MLEETQDLWRGSFHAQARTTPDQLSRYLIRFRIWHTIDSVREMACLSDSDRWKWTGTVIISTFDHLETGLVTMQELSTLTKTLNSRLSLLVLKYVSSTHLRRNCVLVCRSWMRRAKEVLRKREDTLCRIEFNEEDPVGQPSQYSSISAVLRLSKLICFGDHCFHMYSLSELMCVPYDTKTVQVEIMTIGRKRPVLFRDRFPLHLARSWIQSTIAVCDDICIHVRYLRQTYFAVSLFVSDPTLQPIPLAHVLRHLPNLGLFNTGFKMASLDLAVSSIKPLQFIDMKSEYYAIYALISPTPSAALHDCMTNLTFPSIMDVLTRNALRLESKLERRSRRKESRACVLSIGMDFVKSHLSATPFGEELFKALMGDDVDLDQFFRVLWACNRGDLEFKWKRYGAEQITWQVTACCFTQTSNVIHELSAQLTKAPLARAVH